MVRNPETQPPPVRLTDDDVNSLEELWDVIFLGHKPPEGYRELSKGEIDSFSQNLARNELPPGFASVKELIEWLKTPQEDNA